MTGLDQYNEKWDQAEYLRALGNIYNSGFDKIFEVPYPKGTKSKDVRKYKALIKMLSVYSTGHRLPLYLTQSMLGRFFGVTKSSAMQTLEKAGLVKRILKGSKGGRPDLWQYLGPLKFPKKRKEAAPKPKKEKPAPDEVARAVEDSVYKELCRTILVDAIGLTREQAEEIINDHSPKDPSPVCGSLFE